MKIVSSGIGGEGTSSSAGNIGPETDDLEPTLKKKKLSLRGGERRCLGLPGQSVGSTGSRSSEILFQIRDGEQ